MLRFIGSGFQINIDNGGGNGISGNQQLPRITTLSNGQFGVVYQSDYFGNANNLDVVAAILTSDGSLSAVPYVDVDIAAQDQDQPTAAPLLGGGLGVVFTNQLHADGTSDSTSNITYVAVAANGSLGTPLAIGDFNAGAGSDSRMSLPTRVNFNAQNAQGSPCAKLRRKAVRADYIEKNVIVTSARENPLKRHNLTTR
jgi:hypothetical protein